MTRFEGCRPLYKSARSGGVGAFTVDNFPVFDYFRPNLYGIFDSNHGYKMIGVGKEVARRAPRRALAPALPVPLRALRDRRPPPGLELALSLVLASGRREVGGVSERLPALVQPEPPPEPAFVVVCTASVTTIASATVVTISSASGTPRPTMTPGERRRDDSGLACPGEEDDLLPRPAPAPVRQQAERGR